MARPRKHDGRLFRKVESKFWWMDYRDRDGKRQRESTNTDDWRKLKRRYARMQARDGNTLPLLRKGEKLGSFSGLNTSCRHFPSRRSGLRRRTCPILVWQSTSMPDLARF